MVLSRLLPNCLEAKLIVSDTLEASGRSVAVTSDLLIDSKKCDHIAFIGRVL